MAQSERVKQMKKDFIKYRESGKTIKEIANIFGLTDRTVYLHLQDIADENNLSRDELLFRVHKQHIRVSNKQVNEKKEIIDIDEMKKEFNEMLKTSENIIEKIEETLETQQI